MPIYEYQCEDCEHKLELIQKINDIPLTECPACGKDSMRKLVSAAAFQLKGTGWYATDFKDKPKDNTKKKEAPNGGSDKSKDKKSSDTAVKSSKKDSSSTTTD